MRSRLHDVPILKTTPTCIEAMYYNRVRIALSRIDNPLRIELINLRGLDIVIDDEVWVCVDRTLNDLPIFAWTDFEYNARQNLFEPIACRLRFYHNHADLICGTVLDLINRNLDARLSRLREHHIPSKVTYLRTKKRKLSRFT
ncbi:MAG: hypothetical protein LJE85_13430 [Gammaproteobacteria bacterium]|jgi:hypothetical protein|nr:hypothetical protein [Gammaproteobacteria bacterium]